jgi:hypothetical protein
MDRPIRRAKKMPWSDRFETADWPVGLGHNGIARLMGRSSISGLTTTTKVLLHMYCTIVIGFMSCRTTRLNICTRADVRLTVSNPGRCHRSQLSVCWYSTSCHSIYKQSGGLGYLQYSGLLYWREGADWVFAWSELFRRVEDVLKNCLARSS